MNIELALTLDKAILIRILCTMSLFGYTREAPELSSQFFVRAVHLSFTLGLHHHSDSNGENQRLDGLFCYVWSVDRLHAAMQGRPVIIHERDMSVTPVERSREQLPGHRVFVKIAALLDKVIALYRPNCVDTEIPMAEFPLYEDILADCDGLELPSRITGRNSFIMVSSKIWLIILQKPWNSYIMQLRFCLVGFDQTRLNPSH